MSGFAQCLTLELQIIIINVIGLVICIVNWSWLKWDRQQEKISNFSVSQSDELDVEDIDWLKTILSWVEIARFVINHVSFLAYVANIYTIVTRSWQNLLILWMVLSFLKDIILEVVVIVITFLLWHKGNVLTSRFVEFIVKKIIWLVISTCIWCTIFRWYTQLRRVAKIRRFTIIARRSIANLANVPGRVGRSLDDECLDIAITRRGKYASLLNLDRLSEESSSRVNAKSLTTLVTDDTSDANDNSDANDLSVAEKSMRMLNVTAEDVMDARARIQERSYWNERDAIAETPEVIEDVITHSFEKNEKEIIDTSRNKQPAKDDLEKVVDRTLKKEIMEYLPVKKKGGKNDKIVRVDGKEQILTGNQEDISLVKNEDITSDKVDDHAKSTDSGDIYVTPKMKRKEEKGVAKMVQCPSDQNARNMETKPCASLVRKLGAKAFCPIPVNQQEKWIDRVDRRKHPCQVDTQLTPTGSNASKKEHYKNSKTSCACHRALRNASKNGKHARSIDIDGKNVEYDINRKEFRSFTPIVNMQRSRVDKSAFKYSEAYRLKKQTQKYEESRRKQSWGSKSLAQTARPSGYAKNVIDASDRLFICRKSVQTETYDESSDSLSAQYRLKHKQMRNRRLVDLRSVYNVASFKEKNYAEAHETKMKALETYDNFTLENKEETKARKGHNLLSANRKLSLENREATELRALRAYNELTLLEDKRELEVRKERDSSLNYERLTKKSEVPEMKVSKTYNDPTLSEDIEETERRREHNLSPSSQQSIERSASRVHNKLTRSGSKRELQTGRKRDSSRVETPSECEEDVETPSVSNRLSKGSYEDTTISTRRNANSSSGLNDRYARQAHMSLNLGEITRNIEWTVHPRGIILANKNLHGQFLENGRLRESRERDIVDDNTASMLHSAFFFKPEIITRVFRRAQMRIGESFPSFSTFRQEDFNTEFVCRTNNEMVVCNRDSSFDCDLERMMGNDRSNLGDSMLANANDNRGTGGEHGHDLCIIFIDREQVPSESETAIMENSTTVGSQEDARSSIESARTMNILVFDEDHDHVDNATNDNLSLRLITNVLRNFDIEMSERNTRDVALPIEEYTNVSNVNIDNNPQPGEFNTDDINPDEENNNECARISSHKNADVDDTIHEIEQTLNSSDNRLDNVTSYVSSLEKLNNSRDKKYLNTIDIHSKNEIYENKLSLKSTDNNTSQLSSNNNNKQFDTLDNKTEKSMFNRVFKNSSKLSFPGPSSFIESDNCHALRSCDEKLQKLTQLSDSATMLNDKKKESVSNLKTMNYDTIPQFRSVETLKLETMIQDGARSKNENRDEESNEFLAEKFFKMHSDDQLQQDDSFYFTYERNDDSETPVSLEEGSLMEEFLNDPIPPETPLNSSYS